MFLLYVMYIHARPLWLFTTKRVDLKRRLLTYFVNEHGITREKKNKHAILWRISIVRLALLKYENKITDQTKSICIYVVKYIHKCIILCRFIIQARAIQYNI